MPQDRPPISKTMPHVGATPHAAGPGRTSDPSLDPLIGAVLDGRYRIEGVLGEGGMGVVYRARHQVIDKRVAVKVLRLDMAADREMGERFLNEARAASAIGNAHIVDISDFGMLDDGAAYFVMEYLDGQNIGALITEHGAVPVARILHIGKQIARGLEAAHRAGIIHRDLKPDNVMLVARGDDRDFVKVLDFGIAKVGRESAKLTQKGTVFGTPHYMSPEQAAGIAVDHRTDVYSLGVILYEMAVGKVPFDADNFMGILTQHMYKAPVRPREIYPAPQEVPPGLEAIVLKCLSKKRELRYQTMAELAADLERAEQGLVPEAVTEMMGRSGGFHVSVDYFHKPGAMAAAVPGAPPTRRRPWGLLAGAMGMVAAVAITAAIFAYARATRADAVGADAPVRPDPSPPATAVATLAASSPPRTTKVLLVSDPHDADVLRGDERLGTAPLQIDVVAGAPWTLQVAKRGYRTREVTLDGTAERVSVALERAVAPARTPPPRPAPSTSKPSAKATPAAGSCVRPATCDVVAWDPFECKCR